MPAISPRFRAAIPRTKLAQLGTQHRPEHPKCLAGRDCSFRTRGGSAPVPQSIARKCERYFLRSARFPPTSSQPLVPPRFLRSISAFFYTGRQWYVQSHQACLDQAGRDGKSFLRSSRRQNTPAQELLLSIQREERRALFSLRAAKDVRESPQER